MQKLKCPCSSNSVYITTPFCLKCSSETKTFQEPCMDFTTFLPFAVSTPGSTDPTQERKIWNQADSGSNMNVSINQKDHLGSAKFC